MGLLPCLVSSSEIPAPSLEVASSSPVVVAEIDRHHLAKNPTQGNERERQSTADIDSITAAIRGAVTRNHDLSTHAICLIKQATIPRTSSGKIQRHLCREQYLAGGLILAES